MVRRARRRRSSLLSCVENRIKLDVRFDTEEKKRLTGGYVIFGYLQPRSSLFSSHVTQRCDPCAKNRDPKKPVSQNRKRCVRMWLRQDHKLTIDTSAIAGQCPLTAKKAHINSGTGRPATILPPLSFHHLVAKCASSPSKNPRPGCRLSAYPLCNPFIATGRSIHLPTFTRFDTTRIKKMFSKAVVLVFLAIALSSTTTQAIPGRPPNQKSTSSIVRLHPHSRPIFFLLPDFTRLPLLPRNLPLRVPTVITVCILLRV